MRFFVLFILSSIVFAQKFPLIDQNLKRIEDKEEQLILSCNKINNITKSIYCVDQVKRQYKNNKLLRGTLGYCQNNYFETNIDGLMLKLQHLKKDKSIARKESDIKSSNDRYNGEIFVSTLDKEIFFIEREIHMRQRNNS